MKLVLCLALLVSISSLTVLVEGLSTGAPVAACDTLSPNPIGHEAGPQGSAVPYSIDISAFLENGTYSYYPGRTYTREYRPQIHSLIKLATSALY